MTRFSGAVLAGGSSRRMGVGIDKALVEIDGRPMVARVVDALEAAGACGTVVVGGDREAMLGLGLDPVDDRWPGAGPLGGVATALGGAIDADVDIVVVLACDLLAPNPAAIESLLAALDADPVADAAVPQVDGRYQWLHAAWRTRVAARLSSALDGGERAVHRAVDRQRLRIATVSGLDPGQVADADTPDRLPPGAR